MFYEEERINKLFCCQKCEEQLDEPRMLTCCGKTICNSCVFEMESTLIKSTNQIKCIICNEMLHYPAKGLPINGIVLTLMNEKPKEVYRSAEADKLKTNLIKMKSNLNSFVNDFNNSEAKIKDHCIELRRLVQLSTEQKILEIYNFNEYFIKQIDQYETVCITNLKTNDLKKTKFIKTMNEINKFHADKTAYLKGYQINDQEVIQSNKTSELYAGKLEEETKHLTEFIFNANQIDFVINLNKLEQSVLGSIVLKNLGTLNFNYCKKFSLADYNCQKVFFEVFDHEKSVILLKNEQNWEIKIFKNFKCILSKNLKDYLLNYHDPYGSNCLSLNFIHDMTLNKSLKCIAIFYQNSMHNQGFNGNTNLPNMLVLDENLNLVWNSEKNHQSKLSISTYGIAPVKNDDLLAKFFKNGNAPTKESWLYIIKPYEHNKTHYYNQSNNQKYIFDLFKFTEAENSFPVQNIRPDNPYFIAIDALQTFLMQDKIVWRDNSSVNIMNTKNGLLVKQIDIKSNQFEMNISKNELLVLMKTNDKLKVYDLNGNFIRELLIIIKNDVNPKVGRSPMKPFRKRNIVRNGVDFDTEMTPELVFKTDETGNFYFYDLNSFTFYCT